jgi:hypothetical protein
MSSASLVGVLWQRYEYTKEDMHALARLRSTV